MPEWDWKRRILKEKGGRRQGMEENVECGLKDFSNIPNKKAPQLQPLKIQGLQTIGASFTAFTVRVKSFTISSKSISES